MAWLVIEDHLDGVEDDTAVGRGQWDGDQPPALTALPDRALLYDDDGILYYTIAFDRAAELDDEAWGGLYQAYCWGEWFAGTTDLRVAGESVYA